MAKLSNELDAALAELIREGDSMSYDELEAALAKMLPSITGVADTEKAAAVRLAHERGELEKKLTTAQTSLRKAETDLKAAKDEAGETRLPEGTLTVFSKDGGEHLQVIVLRDAPDALIEKIVETAKDFLAAGTDNVGPPVTKSMSLGGYIGWPQWGSATVQRIVGDQGRLAKAAAPSESPADKSLVDWVRSGRAGAGPRVTLT